MTGMLIHGRLRTLGVLAALAPAVLFAAAPAQAARSTSAVCLVRFTATITPGFSLTPGPGTFTTGGETGSMSCIGKIGGDRVTGRGSVGVDETYTGGSCTSHVGTGTVSITIPTTAGVKHVVGDLTVRRTALVVRPEVRFPNARFSSIGVSIPRQGNCVATPLQKALVVLAGVLSGP